MSPFCSKGKAGCGAHSLFTPTQVGSAFCICWRTRGLCPGPSINYGCCQPLGLTGTEMHCHSAVWLIESLRSEKTAEITWFNQAAKTGRELNAVYFQNTVWSKKVNRFSSAWICDGNVPFLARKRSISCKFLWKCCLTKPLCWLESNRAGLTHQGGESLGTGEALLGRNLSCCRTGYCFFLPLE